MTQALVISYWVSDSNAHIGTFNRAAVLDYALTSFRDQPEANAAQSPRTNAKAFVCLIDAPGAVITQMIGDYNTQLANAAFFPLWWPGQNINNPLTTVQQTAFVNWLVARGVNSTVANNFLANNPTRFQIARAVANASGQA